MDKRKFGRTGLSVSVLTFGCGAVGGLMTRGAPADQERAVARAIEAGVNHFDTAALYGDGASEENLGRVLARAEARRHRQHQGAAAGGAQYRRRSRPRWKPRCGG